VLAVQLSERLEVQKIPAIIVSMMWSYAHAVVPQPKRSITGTPCEDCGLVETRINAANQEVLFAVVGDGAAGASKAQVGAELASSTLQRLFRSWVTTSRSVSEVNRDCLESWFKQVREAVASDGEKTGLDLFQYSCTLLLAVAGPDCSVYAQVGDGAIVTGNGSVFHYVFWPESGEFNNMTYFVTDKDALDHLQVKVHNGEPQAMALFSDGIEQVLLRFQNRTARSDIFTVLFERLAKEAPGYSEAMAKELDGFLCSPAVLSRIYDDRTLVLAQPHSVAPHGTRTAKLQ
jgi:hypothetical protein